MTASRDSILAAVRSATVPASPLPTRFQQGIRYDDPLSQFADSLKLVGGNPIITTDAGSARDALGLTGVVIAGRKICSLCPEIVPSTFDLDSVDDPHTLEDVWLTVLPGEFAVAENAAVWLWAGRLKQRVVPFLTQHLVLVVPRSQVVNNMHEAYDRLKFDRGEFGVFISGPSKTADIEQSLVIGAHGARSLSVILF